MIVAVAVIGVVVAAVAVVGVVVAVTSPSFNAGFSGLKRGLRLRDLDGVFRLSCLISSSCAARRMSSTNTACRSEAFSSAI